MYVTDCCFGLKPNCSLITSAIFVLQSTCVSTFGICWGEATKIAEVMREQFGLRPKQQSVMYKAPYPPAYNQIPLPHKYKMPDFTKFSGQGEVSTMEHVNRFLLQLGEAATMMHSESVCSPFLCLDRPLLGSLLCQQIPYYIGPIWRDNFISFSTLGLLN